MKFFRKVTKFVRNILVAANVLVIAAMCACGYAGHYSPEHHSWLEMFVLAFPVPLTLNLLFVLVWLFISPRRMLIPIVGLLLCWGPVRAYCPVNFPKSHDEEGIKVMSFNVAAYSVAPKKKEVLNTCVEYILNHQADILCLQEDNIGSSGRKKLEKLLAKAYPYSETIKRESMEAVSFHSKYPILATERIVYGAKRNTCGAALINVEGDTVLVGNVHFESNFLKENEKKEIGSMINTRKIDIDREKGSLMKKLCYASGRRASQANAVATFLKNHKGMTTILCGDFNDPPNSYPYHRVAQWLDNCYESTGTGLAYTFNNNGLKVRIDNIFCSKDLETIKCEIDDKTDVSDHYPITAWIKKRPKR
ncbi:MAG: endonuclease/exonuclease/phosphatase family protein [Prevotella sp.]|nr:endonuclease/exonuclease/phosphatase family protein [Prevotella sp.]